MFIDAAASTAKFPSTIDDRQVLSPTLASPSRTARAALRPRSGRDKPLRASPCRPVAHYGTTDAWAGRRTERTGCTSRQTALTDRPLVGRCGARRIAAAGPTAQRHDRLSAPPAQVEGGSFAEAAAAATAAETAAAAASAAPDLSSSALQSSLPHPRLVLAEWRERRLSQSASARHDTGSGPAYG